MPANWTDMIPGADWANDSQKPFYQTGIFYGAIIK